MALQDRIKLLHKAFPELPEALLTELAHKVRERTYPMGTVLCAEENIENTFYILCSGRVVISKLLDGETSRILAYQGPGEFFGELALIQDSRRVATVVTLEESTVFELDKKDFTEFLESSPAMVVTIMRAVVARLRDADQRSITELRRKNKELSHAYRGLEAENQQRSRFLTGVAHQLRTPLASVKNTINLLDSDSLEAEAANAIVNTVSDNVDDIVQLVNNILLLQELELIEPQFRPVDISHIVQQAVSDLAPAARRAGVNIQVDMPPDLPQIIGDPGGLKHAMAALLENAIKFTPRGCKVDVRLHLQAQDLEISVQDSGKGIAPIEVEQLFNAVRQSESPAQALSSHNLGLPIAKAVVEQHGGQLQFSHAPGCGNCFTLYLPLSPGK